MEPSDRRRRDADGSVVDAVTCESRATGDRGAAEVVAAILIAPVIVGLVVALFYLGREVDGRAAVRTAAEAAAQAAARQRDPESAVQAAERTAEEMLGDDSTCMNGPSVVVAVGDFRSGGVVNVDVTCGTRVDDLTFIDASERSFTAHGTAVVDTYRAVRP